MAEQIFKASQSGAARVNEPKQNVDVGLEQIRQALHGLKYGQVIAVVQDGVIVQIERIEKRRIV